MKNLTISVTEKFFARLCRMSKEIGGPASGLGTITRNGLRAEVARHEAKVKRTRDYFMQEVDQDTPLSEILKMAERAAPASTENQVERIRALLATGAAGEDPLATILTIAVIIEPATMAQILVSVSESGEQASA